jgi:hypothetical protein
MAHVFKPSLILQMAWDGFMFSADREALQQGVVAVQEEHLSHLFDEVAKRHRVHLGPGGVIEEASVRIVWPSGILTLRSAAHAAHGDLAEDTIHGPSAETVLLQLSRGITTGKKPCRYLFGAPVEVCTCGRIFMPSQGLTGTQEDVQTVPP